MNQLHLKYFLTAAEQKHFSKAAQILQISQASLSISISKLEQEIGHPLFERQGRTMQLTPYGQILRHYAAIIIADMQDLALELAESNGQAPPYTILLGISHVLISDHWLLQLMKQHPQLLFKKQLFSPVKLQEKLLCRELDFGLSAPLPFHPHLQSIPLIEDDFLILFPPQESLPNTPSISLQQLAQLPFLCQLPSDQQRAIDLLACQLGFPLTIVYEGPEESVLDLFCHGYGVLLCSSTQIPLLDQLPCRCRYLPLQETSIRNTIHLTWHKDRYFPPDARQFYQLLLQTHTVQSPEFSI